MAEKRGPWQFIKRDEKYINPWIRVYEDEVVTPSGKPGIYGVVESDPGVFVLPIDPEGNIYLIKEYKYIVGKVSLEVVSGAKEKTETFKEAAERELAEELGIKAKKLLTIGINDPLTGIVNIPAQLFLATDLEFGAQSLEDTEKIELVKMTLDEAVEKIIKNEITDGLSCVIILKTSEMRRRKLI